MNYLHYLQQKHFLALLCGLVSTLLAFIEGKYNTKKYDYKYYIKILILVFLNVYIILYLMEKKIISVDGISIIAQKGGASTSNQSGSSYNKVDIGNPTF